LRAALNRVAEGTCGFCVDCEEPIAPKRLAAVRWTPPSTLKIGINSLCLLVAPSEGAILAPDPFVHLSLLADHLRTVLAVKGSLRRAQQRRAFDRSGPFPSNPSNKRERFSVDMWATSAPFWALSDCHRHLGNKVPQALEHCQCRNKTPAVLPVLTTAPTGPSEIGERQVCLFLLTSTENCTVSVRATASMHGLLRW